MAAEAGRARLVRKLSRILVTAAGCSTWGQWPAPDTWTVRASVNRGATTSRISSAEEKVSSLSINSTGVLTAEMFHSVFARVKADLD